MAELNRSTNKAVRAKTLERSIYLLAFAIFAVPFALPYLGIHGFRGDLQRFAPRIGAMFFVGALVCGGYVGQERRKIEALEDGRERQQRERALSRKVGWIGVTLMLVLPCGYFIGRQF